MKTKRQPTAAERAAATFTKSTAPFVVKAIDEDARTFSGLAAAWSLDLGDDVIEPGAFRRTLKEWRAGGRVLPLIDQHNYGSIRMVVGKMIKAVETDEGLQATFEVIDGPDGDEVLRRVKGGYVDGLSIGYEPKKWSYEDSDDARFGVIRHLEDVELREVSVVIWPMNEDARIDGASAKSLLAPLVSHLTDDGKKVLRELLDAPAPTPKTQQQNQPQDSEPDDGKGEEIDAPDESLYIGLLARRLPLTAATGQES